MVKEDYSIYVKNFKIAWNAIVSKSTPIEETVDKICEYRLYYDGYERWLELFKKVGVAFIPEEDSYIQKLDKDEFKDLKLFREDGGFLLTGRFIIPIRDILGNIIALVGWYPDEKKYITTPSKYFSKQCLFFGLEQVGEYGLGQDFALVEGIFDTLSLRSIGIKAVGQMGITGSEMKKINYGLFGKLLAIPDSGDKQGKKVWEKDDWGIPRNSSYLRWTGSFDEDVRVKDIDDLIRLFDDKSIRKIIKECFKSHKRNIRLEF